MFDSIVNANDFLSEHWLAEIFPARLKDLTARWRDDTEHGKPVPVRQLVGVATPYLAALAGLPTPRDEAYVQAVSELHVSLISALGFAAVPTDLITTQGDTPMTVPLIARVQGLSGDALHVLQARPVDALDELFGDEARLVQPLRVSSSSEKVERVESPARAVQQLFQTDEPPRYLLLVAGSWLLLTDVARWAEGRYLAFDIRTALSRRDDRATGELAWHAGLCAADVLLPGGDGTPVLDHFTQDSERHAIGVSADLREGLRTSIELIAGEVLDQRRRAGQPVEGVDELPRELTSESLRFLYRVLFLLYAEARPELGILPVNVPEYGAGYGLDRLRDLIQVPLTGASQAGHHLHDSLNVLFRLVNEGHGRGPEVVDHDGKQLEGNKSAGNMRAADKTVATHEGLVFEALKADLFDPGRTPHIDSLQLSNAVLQRVLQLLLLSKPSSRKGSQRGYISYAQLGINQLGAVYEGLMSYSGIIATEEMVEVAKGGNADKGSWLVPSKRAGDYIEDDLVWREDRLTGAKSPVRHPQGGFVFRLSGRERQRSASYYTPEILTRTVVTHALAELITDETSAEDILNYRICEPALGSGAFLNEAINQLAKAYLERRQTELDQRIEPEQYAVEEQKVKAYLALHRAYGVDLNATAVELAEVSLWLNVMYPRLQAPWFGLHLRRGNSLIGARRATYDLAALARAKKSWLSTPPSERPLATGPIVEGEIHHFLLPADGWGAVAGAKQAKERAPEQAGALRVWQREMKKKPGVKDLARLKALARRVERLWTLTMRRLEVSESEIARHVDVWGAALPPVHSAVTRHQVESALHEPGSPYQRLRWVMDAWCALWFWPLDGGEPPTLADWLDGLEAVLGLDIGKPGQGVSDDRLGLFADSLSFADLAYTDTNEIALFQMKSELAILSEHPWLGRVREIASREGFFHWELDFAQVFARGGFDLQVGNPPWVRPVWKDDLVLSEYDPFFSLQEKIPENVFRARRDAVLHTAAAERPYLAELASWAGTAEYLGSPIEHQILAGMQTNLYSNFMERTWRSSSAEGVVGLLHPDGHFSDPNAGPLRRTAYSRLRLHAQFTNKLMLFEEVSSSREFSVAIYARPQACNFLSVTSLFSVSTLDLSLTHDREGAVPDMQTSNGAWNISPHRSRIVTVSPSVLQTWATIVDDAGTDVAEARMVRSYSQEMLDILSVLALSGRRVGDHRTRISTGWHQTARIEDLTVEYKTQRPPDWNEVVLQGNHIGLGSAFAAEPNLACRNRYDWSDLDASEIHQRFIPRTNYQRSCPLDIYSSRMDHWNSLPCNNYWRLAWPMMIDLTTERSLRSAIIPPGPTHVNALGSIGFLADAAEEVGPSLEWAARHNFASLVIAAGLWSSLPLDFLVKVRGKPNANGDLVASLPLPSSHPAASYLRLRTLRLNCLTGDYAPLWETAYDAEFAADAWTASFTEWPTLAVTDGSWTIETPLRSEYERRAALVEIDALAALMLGLTADHLVLIFRTLFPVLRKYEREMYFDNVGQKIAKDHHARGIGQGEDDYRLLQAYLGGENCGDLLDRYEPHPDGKTDPALGFIRPDREAEMRTAHAEFSRRLRL